MEIREFEGFGRKLMVEFSCRRCKTKAVRPLADCLPKESCVRGLYDLDPPEEWKNGGFYYPLLCTYCADKYERFMKGEI